MYLPIYLCRAFQWIHVIWWSDHVPFPSYPISKCPEGPVNVDTLVSFKSSRKMSGAWDFHKGWTVYMSYAHCCSTCFVVHYASTNGSYGPTMCWRYMKTSGSMCRMFSIKAPNLGPNLVFGDFMVVPQAFEETKPDPISSWTTKFPLKPHGLLPPTP